ncbi:MAG TPA: methyltransferase domain-containing protein [Blastocatellia bacterium]|nr:methyltransferase domain-containing protein [Blastocatellia bacterium]
MPSMEAPATMASQDEAKMKKPLISNWLDEFEQKAASEFQRRTGLDYKATIAEAIAAAEPQLGMQVLDVATGTGVIARQLISHIGAKGRIIGVDATQEMVDKARLAAQSAGLSRYLEWQVAAAERLPFNVGEFDIVTCTMALYRLKVQKFLKEAYRVLKPGGRLVIATELTPQTSVGALRLKLKRSYYQFVARNPDEADAHYYSSDEIGEMINAAGFRQTVIRVLQPKSRRAMIFSLIKAVK